MNQESDVFKIEEEANPYTHLNFKNDPDEFQFAIITDNAGGARPGVFPKAVEMANLLQPEFVVNAGDPQNRPVGLLDIHDCLRAGLR